MDATTVIQRLGLQPHPEGGHYHETFRDAGTAGGRGAVTAIYYLLAAGEVSAWHRVDAVELWLWHAGAPLALSVAAGDEVPAVLRLGPDFVAGDAPQGVVPAGAWQSAVSLGDWTLVSCVVAPAFRFEGFELAAAGWSPGAPLFR